MTHVTHTIQRAKPFIRLGAERIRGAVDGGRALDVGCCEGRHVLFLASIGISALGIDMDAEAITVARQRAKEQGLDKLAHFEVADITQGFDGSFGAVVCTEVMQDISPGQWSNVFDTMRSVTPRGGIHLVSGYVNEYVNGTGRRAFVPGQLDGNYREADWNIVVSQTDATTFGQYGAVTSLARVIAQRP